MLFAFGIASLLTIGLGAVVMVQADASSGIWIRNPIAWLIAGAISLFLASRGWLGASLMLIALVVIALTFIGPDQQGVRRWLDFGPVLLNAAALLLPAAIAVFPRTPATVAIVTFAVIAPLLALQPDISQLAPFCLAALVLFAARFDWKGAIPALLVGAALIALCLTRPDPLAPVAHVEGIFLLAWSQSPGLALAMAAALAATALSPLLLWRSPAAIALTAYFGLTAAACVVGAYPVPLAGYGVSFVIGWWLGLACLCVGRPNSVNSLTASQFWLRRRGIFFAPAAKFILRLPRCGIR
jgi:cell division protein FtsW (lipid II flippase)